jgi:hypothetical protein
VPLPEWFDLVSKGGVYVCLLAAIYWLNTERLRLLGEIKLKDEAIAERDEKVESLAERVLTVSTELKMWLSNERRGSA